MALLCTALAMASSTPITNAVFMFFFKYLPGFSHNRSLARIMLLTYFALACLAGMGVEAWAEFWRRKALIGGVKKFLVQGVPTLLLVLAIGDLFHFAWVNTSSNGGSYDYHEYWDPGRFLNPAKLLKVIQQDPTYPRIQPETTADSDYEMIQKVQALMCGIQELTQWSAEYLQNQWRYNETPLPDLVRLTYRFQRPEWKISERWQPLPGFPGFLTDTKAFPRVFMTGGYEVDPDFNQAIYDIRDGKVDPHQEVILTRDPLDKPNWAKGWVGEGKITRYDLNDVEMACTNDRPCFLTLSDNYFPGWRAWVDGREEPIYQADGTFRAVELGEPGSHTVKMSYHPAIIIDSFFYSLFFWVLLAIFWACRGKLEAWYSSLFGGRLIFATPLETIRAQAREQKEKNAGGKPQVRRRKK